MRRRWAHAAKRGSKADQNKVWARAKAMATPCAGLPALRGRGRRGLDGLIRLPGNGLLLEELDGRRSFLLRVKAAELAARQCPEHSRRHSMLPVLDTDCGVAGLSLPQKQRPRDECQ